MKKILLIMLIGMFLLILVPTKAFWQEGYGTDLLAWYDFETGSGLHITERVKGIANGTFNYSDGSFNWIDNGL